MRRGSESNRRIQLLQSRALPLGYPAARSFNTTRRPLWQLNLCPNLGWAAHIFSRNLPDAGFQVEQSS